VCVDPEDPQAIAEAIDRLVLDRDSAEEMGSNGMRAVSERYNWDAEGRRLADFYESFRRG
jgi:glycosyltransferase involved in cell wall biosynthesis